MQIQDHELDKVQKSQPVLKKKKRVLSLQGFYLHKVKIYHKRSNNKPHKAAGWLRFQERIFTDPPTKAPI